MAGLLETPSRIWRRIEAVQDKEMPSLPSLPSFDNDSEEDSILGIESTDDALDTSFDDFPSPKHSTPAPSSHYASRSTIRPLSNSHNTRFSNSIGAKSARSSVGPTTAKSQKNSFFDITDIPSLSNISKHRLELSDTDEEEVRKITEVYDPGFDKEYSISSALESISRGSSPPLANKSATPKKPLEYSVSLKSEPKASPFDKYRNVGLRRSTNIAGRTRTPSLTRTTDSSSTTSPAASTPKSNNSLNKTWADEASTIPAAKFPLPRSATASPAQTAQRSVDQQSNASSAMDITDSHIVPQRMGELEEESPTYDEPEPDTFERQNYAADENRDPTFSSESEPGSYAHSNRTIVPGFAAASPGDFSNAESNSMAMTPTPAFPRPRARFDVPPPSSLFQTPAPRNAAEDDDLTTPATRRKSFLLSIVNSTARPRMKVGTPHASRFVPATPSIAEGVSHEEETSPEAAPATAAFIGVTPRPRAQFGAARRLSHPLSQVANVSPMASATPPAAIKQWGASPGINSPYDGANDKASFVSVASSHDLTTHHRVNTSFDPAMGFGGAGQGHGVGRFNANKLNNYLHSLNRRLQEENESLLARLRKIEEEKAAAKDRSMERKTAARGRVSLGGALDDVQEDSAESWLEEKAELEDMVEGFKEEAEKYMAEKEELEKELETEREERQRDKGRWEQRMREAEEGIVGIITDLEKRLATAQEKADTAEEEASERLKVAEQQVVAVQEELANANQRANAAERLLENGKDLGGALREANDRITHLMGDLRNANTHIKEMEEEATHADQRLEELEGEIKERDEILAKLEAELSSNDTQGPKMKNYEETIARMEEEMQGARTYVDELEEGAAIAVEQIEKLEKELTIAQETMEALKRAEENSAKMIEDLEQDTKRAHDLTKQVEEALEHAERKMSEDDEALRDLQSKVTALERERDRYKLLADSPRERSLRLDSGPTEEELELLERELDDAHKEIARLTTTMSQSPARKAMEKARDAKMEMLEKEKEELLKRNKALRMSFADAQTPRRVSNASTISPMARHVLSMSIRLPRTPGGPLRDMSWLNSTMNDPSVSPLVAEINRLQQELELANESIDDKLDKLEDAGLGVVGLTKKLEDARARISHLEEELSRTLRKEDRQMRRLERARCKKCNVKLDVHRLTTDDSTCDASLLASEPPTPPTRTAEALRIQLQAANASLEHLRDEMAELQADNKRLGGQVRNAKAEVKKAAETKRLGDKSKTDVQGELEKAKDTIAELEDALASERAKLRSLTAEQATVEKEKKHVLQDLKRTEADMDTVKEQLQKLKRQNQDLENELRLNSTAEQKARLLETKVAENLDLISQLRHERTQLTADHKGLQRRYQELSDTVSRLREEHAAHSNSHDNRRHKLDLQVLEIDDLKQALNTRSSQLQRVEQEKERISNEKSDVARTVATLEADLRRVRRDAEAFGRDLKSLKSEKEKIEAKLADEIARGDRAKKQSSAQLKVLNEQIESQKRKFAIALEDYESHVCSTGNDEVQISKLKMQHNKECKGLMVNIRYLKAKFTREAAFREDLQNQKRYILEILAQFEQSEKNILAAISRVGFGPRKSATKKPRKTTCRLKSVALAVVFLNRTKKGLDAWKDQCVDKARINAALQEVRRRRVAPLP